jgi:23S rRNA (uracil1939-C5)-methyltransferase
VVYRGKGLARQDGKVVFVAGVLPGETVNAQFTHHSKNYAEAELMEVKKASPARIEPVCPLFLRAGRNRIQAGQTCPGCAYQHMAYGTEMDLKSNQFKNLMERMGGVDPAVCLSPVASPGDTGYRNKIVLHGSQSENGPRLGYFAEDNKTVIDVFNCSLGNEPINNLIAATRSKDGFMGSVTDQMTAVFRFTGKDGALFWTPKDKESGAWLTESSVLGEIHVPSDSFFQVNTKLADLLVSHVIDLLKESANEYVVDLYCGVGMFALAAVQAGAKQVIGVDFDPEAIGAAKKNAEDRGFTQVEFISTTAQKGAKGSLGRTNPGKSTVIVDPPRRGLDKQVLERLGAMGPADIIYVSCAADTMARDVRQLREAGYLVKNARLFDMFPRTPYFESVTWLQKR